jgi:hypothetical protein
MILLLEPWPAVMAHCEAAVLFLHCSASVADKIPLQPLTVAPLTILVKHWPSLGIEQWSTWRLSGLCAQFGSSAELQMTQFSSRRTVSMLQSLAVEQEEHRGLVVFVVELEVEQRSWFVADWSDKHPFMATLSVGEKIITNETRTKPKLKLTFIENRHATVVLLVVDTEPWHGVLARSNTVASPTRLPVTRIVVDVAFVYVAAELAVVVRCAVKAFLQVFNTATLQSFVLQQTSEAAFVAVLGWHFSRTSDTSRVNCRVADCTHLTEGRCNGVAAISATLNAVLVVLTAVDLVLESWRATAFPNLSFLRKDSDATLFLPMMTAVIQMIFVSFTTYAVADLTLKAIDQRELNGIAIVVSANAASILSVVVSATCSCVCEFIRAASDANSVLIDSHVAVRQTINDISRMARLEAFNSMAFVAFLAASRWVVVAVSRQAFVAEKLRWIVADLSSASCCIWVATTIENFVGVVVERDAGLLWSVVEFTSSRWDGHCFASIVAALETRQTVRWVENVVASIAFACWTIGTCAWTLVLEISSATLLNMLPNWSIISW